jgi:hypothetical protein
MVDVYQRLSLNFCLHFIGCVPVSLFNPEAGGGNFIRNPEEPLHVLTSRRKRTIIFASTVLGIPSPTLLVSYIEDPYGNVIHIYLGLPSGLFPSGFPTNVLNGLIWLRIWRSQL